MAGTVARGNTPPPGREFADLGGGCFWCLEAVFDELAGVDSVESGYMGGARPNPTYEQVCNGNTGHAEIVRVTFDPQAITFDDLLEVFFAIHDPTTLNRQGNDSGTQYRSVVFHHSPEQKRVTEEVIAALVRERAFRDPIVTELASATVFYEAEGYHQEYFSNNPGQPYCAYVVAPKVAKFRQKFPARRKA